MLRERKRRGRRSVGRSLISLAFPNVVDGLPDVGPQQMRHSSEVKPCDDRDDETCPESPANRRVDFLGGRSQHDADCDCSTEGQSLVRAVWIVASHFKRPALVLENVEVRDFSILSDKDDALILGRRRWIDDIGLWLGSRQTRVVLVRHLGGSCSGNRSRLGHRGRSGRDRGRRMLVDQSR
jgi:hypothetical protein